MYEYLIRTLGYSIVYGESFLIEFVSFCRYKGGPGNFLSELRYNTFMRFAATTTTAIKPQNLPPTDRAAYFHSLRVNLQVIEWKSLMNVILPAEEWGWRLQHGIYEPGLDIRYSEERLIMLGSLNPLDRNCCKIL